MAHELSFDPFSAEGLITLPELEQDSSQVWHGFQLNTEPHLGLLKLAQPVDVKLDALQTDYLKLPLDSVQLPKIDPSPPSTPDVTETRGAEGNVKTGVDVVEEEDIWQSSDLHKPQHENRLISWDHFHEPNHEPSRSAYLSEGGPLLFDALLRDIASGKEATKDLQYAKPSGLRHALFEVALGRSSGFYTWNSESGKFDRPKTSYTISGVSQELLDQIIDTFLVHGTKYRLLMAFKTKAHRQTSLAFAFAGVVQEVSFAIEVFVQESSKDKLTFLQLQELFRGPFRLINALFQMMEVMKPSINVEQQIKDLMDLAEATTTLGTELETIITHLVGSVLQPALQVIDFDIGLSSRNAPSHEEAAAGIKSLLSKQTRDLIQSAYASLQTLEQVDAQKVQMLYQKSQKQRLKICLTWDEVSQCQEKVKEYEHMVSQILLGLDHRDGISAVDAGEALPADTESQHGNAFDFEVNLFNQTTAKVRQSVEDNTNNIQTMIKSFLCGSLDCSSLTQLSSRQGLELSLLPIINAQHRLLSYTAFQVLFKGDSIQSHLHSLYRFHLMADGPFTARLSVALFDADQASSGGKRKTNLSSGLRLQNRDTWPPASSELRLVLTGILSESMSSIQNLDVIEATSFAIRDLPEEELERCRDLNSIYALDFLRLHYKAPDPVLASIITSKALKRYDRIFMYLLRLLRVKDLSQHLLRQTCNKDTSFEYLPLERKLRRDMHHFISTLANYSHNIAIKTHWHRFEMKMQTIQDHLDRNDYDGTLEQARSLDHIRDLHEQTLNDISHALLLRKKQLELRTVIEDIFGMILRYGGTVAARSGSGINDDDKTIERNVKAIYDEFGTKIGIIIAYLNTNGSAGTSTGASTTAGASASAEWGTNILDQVGDEKDGDTANMMDQLLLAIDFSGYYSNNRHKRRR